MARLFFAAVIALNVGLGSAVSGAIDVPLRHLNAVLAAQDDAGLYRLAVDIRDPSGTMLAQPVVVARLNVSTTVRTTRDQGGFSLTASVLAPKDPGHSYNPPAPCQIVKLSLEEAGDAVKAPRRTESMLKLCGEPVILPIAEDRIMTVDVKPAPRRAALLW